MIKIENTNIENLEEDKEVGGGGGKIESSKNNKNAEDTEPTEDDNDETMVLHTILLQNNFLHEFPSVLKEIPSIRVIQLHGNPCAVNHMATNGGTDTKLSTITSR